MRKLLFIALIICILVSLTGCGSKPQEVNTAGFKPALDTKKSYKIHADPSVEFSVNKDCDDLDMTNEFMRFLVTKKELNEMASVKRLVTPTSDLDP